MKKKRSSPQPIAKASPSDPTLPTDHLPNFVNFKGICLHGQILLSYAIDVGQNKYHYIEAPCPLVLGYNINFLESAGPDFYKSRIHANDLKAYEHHILPQILQFLKERNKNNQVSFSYNYRIKTKADNYLTVLQNAAFILHPHTGKPTLEAGFVTDITHFKEDSKMVFIVEQSGEAGKASHNNMLQKKVYFPQHQLFSRREQEILQLITEGVCSKQIAEKLFLSINTINNHRKNMLHKTGTKNFIQLIAYAVRNGIIGLLYFAPADYPVLCF